MPNPSLVVFSLRYFYPDGFDSTVLRENFSRAVRSSSGKVPKATILNDRGVSRVYFSCVLSSSRGSLTPPRFFLEVHFITFLFVVYKRTRVALGYNGREYIFIGINIEHRGRVVSERPKFR